MAKTRTKSAAAAGNANKSSPDAPGSRYSLPNDSTNPPQLFILPKTASKESRIVTFQHPRSLKSSRFLACPSSGLYEFTRISAPTLSPRSWLIENGGQTSTAHSREPCGTENEFRPHVVKDADLYVASAIDPLFIVLPALCATNSSKTSSTPKRMFLSCDDHLDAITDSSGHVFETLRWPTVRNSIGKRMAAVCDVVEAGDESMYRLNEDKLVDEILLKARRMSENGLPKSMEEKFVAKPLEAPIRFTRNSAHADVNVSQIDNSSQTNQAAETAESQTSVSSVASSESFASEASTAATSVSGDTISPAVEALPTAMTPSEEVTKLQRLMVAFNFICSKYIAATLAESLKKRLLAAGGSVDFSPLDDYNARLTKLRHEIMAARSMTDYSRKRTWEEEDDESAARKRKKEEEEKRKKAGESRGVRDLKKVNVSGMKKMSDFFKKK